MFGIPDLTPAQIEAQHKYENARHSVIKAYEIASRNFAYADVPKVFKKNEAGEMVRDYNAEADPTVEQNLTNLVRVARTLAIEMNKDLNVTLSILDVVKEVKLEVAKAANS